MNNKLTTFQAKRLFIISKFINKSLHINVEISSFTINLKLKVNDCELKSLMLNSSSTSLSANQLNTSTPTTTTVTAAAAAAAAATVTATNQTVEQMIIQDSSTKQQPTVPQQPTPSQQTTDTPMNTTLPTPTAVGAGGDQTDTTAVKRKGKFVVKKVETNELLSEAIKSSAPTTNAAVAAADASATSQQTQQHVVPQPAAVASDASTGHNLNTNQSTASLLQHALQQDQQRADLKSIITFSSFF